MKFTVASLTIVFTSTALAAGPDGWNGYGPPSGTGPWPTAKPDWAGPGGAPGDWQSWASQWGTAGWSGWSTWSAWPSNAAAWSSIAANCPITAQDGAANAWSSWATAASWTGPCPFTTGPPGAAPSAWPVNNAQWSSWISASGCPTTVSGYSSWASANPSLASDVSAYWASVSATATAAAVTDPTVTVPAGSIASLGNAGGPEKTGAAPRAAQGNVGGALALAVGMAALL